MVLDDTLIDEDARGSIPGIDEDRIVRCVDRIDDESVGEVVAATEQEVRVLVRKVCGGAVQVADKAGVGGGLGRKDGVIGARVDVVGFEVEVVEGWIGVRDDEGLELEGL